MMLRLPLGTRSRTLARGLGRPTAGMGALCARTVVVPVWITQPAPTEVQQGQLWGSAGDARAGDGTVGGTRAGYSTIGGASAGYTRAGDIRAGDARAGDTETRSWRCSLCRHLKSRPGEDQPRVRRKWEVGRAGSPFPTSTWQPVPLAPLPRFILHCQAPSR